MESTYWKVDMMSAYNRAEHAVEAHVGKLILTEGLEKK